MVSRSIHTRHPRTISLSGEWLWCTDCGAIRPDRAHEPSAWLPPATVDVVSQDVISRWGKSVHSPYPTRRGFYNKPKGAKRVVPTPKRFT